CRTERSRLELLTKQTEEHLGRSIRKAEQHRFLQGVVRDAAPGRDDEDVLWSPLEDAVADAAFAVTFHDAEDRAVRRTLAAATKTTRQELHEGSDGRHGVAARRRIRVLQLDAVAAVDGALAAQTL